MHACSVFPAPIQNLRLLEEVLYDLPPLEGVFLHWHTHGMTSTTSGISSLFARRKQLLGPTTLSGASIQLPCAWDSRPVHARVLRHGPSLSAAETQVLLPPGVLVQKTVSITLAETLLLCTGAGSQRVTRQQLRALSATLDLPSRAFKRCSVNPESCNPADICGWRRGLQKMRLWCELQRPGWSAYKRSARVQSGGTVVTTGVITLLSTWLTLLISLASSFQQGERQPCQM
jgi:hypothetical protein